MEIYKNECLLRTIQPEMKLLEDELLYIIRSPVKLLNHIGEHLIKAGGKRLRPALYFLCARDGVAREDKLFRDKVLPIAASLELIHMATLVHDDVIDNSDSRRGKPTANICWDNRKSILAGDFFLARALSYIAPNTSLREFQIITAMISDLCEGEMSQHCNAFDAGQTESAYETRIFQKTANFIAAACELGAIAAKFADDNITALRQYGHYLGMAFQITDDILDITATEQELGKPSGHDIGQGVVTLPVIRALKTSRHCLELKELVGNPDISALQLDQALAIIRASDAVEYSYAKVGEYLAKARNILPPVLSPEVKDTLLNIIDFVETRRN